MAFEKAKVLKAAEKFLSMGNIAAAIKEYRQIVAHDEDDFTALNMLGDLCVRAGKKQDAVSCFERIAEHYREREFTLKAVAMYKKIDRLNPRDPEIAERLASLYAVQGLVVDARAHYLIVAEAYSRAGDSKKALDVLHKIADLDPQNTEVRLKLAASYLKEGLESEALQAFAEAGARLYTGRSFEKSLQAYTQALQIRPLNLTALQGMVQAHVSLGTAYEAAEHLEKLLADKPDDAGLTLLLLESYLEAQDATGAERATSLLMQHDGSNYTRFLEVARLHLHGGDIDAAARVLSGITERALAGREETQLLELVNEVLARDPEQILALRLLVRVHWWQRDTEKLRAALDRLTEAAEAAGQTEDERYALTQLVRLVPDEPRYADRLKELGGAQDEEHVDEARALTDPHLNQVPTFESFAVVSEESAAPAHSFDQTQGGAGEFEFNSVVTETISDPSASFADLNEELERGESPADSEQQFVAFPPSAGEVDFSGAIFDASANASAAGADSAPDGERREKMLEQELESVDFYIGQGYADIAMDTLEMLERQFATHPAIEVRRQKVNELRNADATPVSQAAPPATEFERGEAAADLPVGDQIAAADVAPAGQTVELSAEHSPMSDNGATAPPPPGKIDSGLADIFEEFRIAAEDEDGAANEDYETHYNMGIAYKEMDLLDEAIREFQAAVTVAKAKDGTPRFLQCCNLLGHCFVQKGIPKAAVSWFKKGLEAPGHSEDEYQALRYELAAAYEQMGDLKQAIDTFTEVYSVDVSYRGVAEKLQDLRAKKTAGKKGKR
jgi:tetratricopeptide (TPR) repeat protein